MTVLPGQKFSADEVVRILVRRRWFVLVPFAIGFAAAPPIAHRLPELYKSETLIMVVPQRVPDTYVRSTVTGKVEDRLRSIGEQIMSRSRLERIVTDFELYPDIRSRAVMEDVIQRMRGEIQVEVEGKESSFRVSYVNRDPKVAQKVTERLASLFIEENLRDRESLADSTDQFLQSQLKDAKQRLVEHEKKLEAYRKRYAGQLPSQLQENLQSIQNAQLQLQSVRETMNRASERRLLIERQIADVETFPTTVVAQSPGSSGDAAVTLTVAQQLAAAEARLEVLRLRYTADHPDVRALQRAIGDLRVQAAEEQQQRADANSSPSVPPAEAARLKRIKDLQAELAVVVRQLESGKAEEAQLKDTIAANQANVGVVPTRESELVELTRDYRTLQETYAGLLAKSEESRLSVNLERRQIGEQFRILDPASLPERPHNQLQRMGLAFSASIFGLLIGLVLVGWLEYRDTTFTREGDVVRVLDLPVLALVPAMASAQEQRARRRHILLVNVVGSLLVVGSLAVVAFWGLQS